MSKSLQKDEIESEPAVSNTKNLRLQSWLKFLKMTTQISELWVVTKSSDFASYVVTRGAERRKARSHGGQRVTGNISGWLLNWKQDTFLDTVFIMGKQAWDLPANLLSPNNVWPLLSLSNSTPPNKSQLVKINWWKYIISMYTCSLYW